MTKRTPAVNREQWLTLGAAAMAPMFAALGSPLPDKLRISCGWPSRGALRSRGRVIGQCWTAAASADGTREIFISPAIQDGLEVLEITAHELCHAALPDDAKHGPPFKKLARGIGLEGKLTATHAGPELRAKLEKIIAEIGKYPHSTVDGLNGMKKQTTRLIKCECPECGYICRTTRQWLDNVGAPFCPHPMHEGRVALEFES